MDEYQKFYKSAAWKRKREQILIRDNYQCQMCVKRLEDAVKSGVYLKPHERHIRRAVNVHHICELKDCWEKRLVDDNLTSLCVECHGIVHGRIGNNTQFQKSNRERLTEEKW